MYGGCCWNFFCYILLLLRIFCCVLIRLVVCLSKLIVECVFGVLVFFFGIFCFLEFVLVFFEVVELKLLLFRFFNWFRIGFFRGKLEGFLRGALCLLVFFGVDLFEFLLLSYSLICRWLFLFLSSLFLVNLGKFFGEFDFLLFIICGNGLLL